MASSHPVMLPKWHLSEEGRTGLQLNVKQLRQEFQSLRTVCGEAFALRAGCPQHPIGRGHQSIEVHMALDVSQYFKSDTFSDAVLVLKALEPADKHLIALEETEDITTEVARFPVHQMVVCQSEYLKVQVQSSQSSRRLPCGGTGLQAHLMLQATAPCMNTFHSINGTRLAAAGTTMARQPQ